MAAQVAVDRSPLSRTRILVTPHLHVERLKSPRRSRLPRCGERLRAVRTDGAPFCRFGSRVAAADGSPQGVWSRQRIVFVRLYSIGRRNRGLSAALEGKKPGERSFGPFSRSFRSPVRRRRVPGKIRTGGFRASGVRVREGGAGKRGLPPAPVSGPGFAPRPPGLVPRTRRTYHRSPRDPTMCRWRCRSFRRRRRFACPTPSPWSSSESPRSSRPR
ncbi:hypothetical protein BH11ARM2_BH11ARM2_24410 [soil metagenome]